MIQLVAVAAVVIVVAHKTQDYREIALDPCCEINYFVNKSNNLIVSEDTVLWFKLNLSI